MTDYTLYCFLESGNAYKTALMLQLCNADWDTKWVNFFKGEHRSPEYLKLNPMGEVPVLVDHTQDDLAISQSGVVLQHLGENFNQFIGQTPEEKRDINSWLFWDNHKFTGYISVVRFLQNFLDKGGEPETEFLRARMMISIKILNKHLESRDWVAAGRPTIADFSLCGYLFWPEHFSIDWADYPAIEAWLGRIKALDNWKSPEDLLPSGPPKA